MKKQPGGFAKCSRPTPRSIEQGAGARLPRHQNARGETRRKVPEEQETTGRIWGGNGKNASCGWLTETLLAPASLAGEEREVPSPGAVRHGRDRAAKPHSELVQGTR